jgi:glycosyltransferase involved in cell wall biosynthesis
VTVTASASAHLAILAPVPDPTMGREHWGGQFVTLAFFEALLRYAPLGRVTFFAADPAVSARRLQAWQGRWQGLERVRIAAFEDLAAILSSDPPLALHMPGNYLHEVAHARSLVPGARFPVTCSAFGSPSFHTALPHHGQDLVCGLRPGDTMVCISDAASTFYGHLFNHQRETAWSHWQGPLREPERVVIPHGIDLAAYRPGRDRRWRSRLRIPDESFVALSLCRLSPSDKMDLLPVLHGFRRWLDRRSADQPVPYLVIAGSDYAGYGAFLQQSAAKLGLLPWVRLVPDPPEAEKRALLQMADAFVALPDNPQEAFGYSVLEAMACGLPIVGADWNGLKETITPDVGVRVPTVWGPALAGVDRLSPLYRSEDFGLMHMLAAQTVAVDVDAAWDALGQWAHAPSEARRIGQAARLRAESVYDWRLIISQYLVVWHASAAVAALQPEAPQGQQWHTAFAQAFAHYPTHWLNGESLVRRRAVAPGGPPRPVYAGVQERVAPALLEGILAVTGEAVTVAALAHQLPGHGPEAVMAHVLWLLKYGWLELG